MMYKSLLALLLPLLLFLPSLASAADLRALIRNVEQQYMGVSSKSVMTMRVKSEHWERTLTMEAWSLGREYFLVRILEPAKEKGVATLKAENNVWNYLPKVDRVIKVPPSMMGGAWMGSHITNDDLVKANHIDEEYTFELLEETREHYMIACHPKPEAAVVWGKVVYEIIRPQLVPGKVVYYDEAQVPVREIDFDEVKKVDGRVLPLRMTVKPYDTPAEQTVIHYDFIDFDIHIDRGFFTLRNLKS